MSGSITTQPPVAPGSAATAREIAQQPEIWRSMSRLVEAERGRLDAFLKPLLEHADLRIVLTGAGTSAFVGLIAAPALSHWLGRRVEAVATTDIVSSPRDAFAEDVPTLLVSFARSGNSPESGAATDLADKLLTDVSHLIITCNEMGRLCEAHEGRTKSMVVLMPEGANDKGFAMTSSFTSMLLACLLILDGGNTEAIASLATMATHVIQSRLPAIHELAAGGFERVVYLGSGPLAGLARESALKLLELTAGRVVAFHDSALGFRHGPKAIVNDKTLVVVYVSPEPYTRQYDLDIVAELRAEMKPENVIAISSTPLPDQSPQTWVLPDAAGLEGAFLAAGFVLVAQLLALSFSSELGMTPDNPFPGGHVNRVVKGVTIHPLDA